MRPVELVYMFGANDRTRAAGAPTLSRHRARVALRRRVPTDQILDLGREHVLPAVQMIIRRRGR